MADAALTLPPALARFVEAQVASGDYPDAQTLIHEAILRLMPRAEADAFRVERFNALVQVGLDQIERGEVIEVTDIRAFLDEIEAEVEAGFADRAA
jgi:putative addiction module CopG family antidote